MAPRSSAETTARQQTPLAEITPQAPEDHWPDGTLRLPPTLEDVTAFIYWRINVYKEEGWCNSDLSEYYSEDFSNFTSDIFGLARPDALRKLRLQLRSAGVFVGGGRGHHRADQLVAAVREELPWPENDPETPQRASSRFAQQPTPITSTAHVRIQEATLSPTPEPLRESSPIPFPSVRRDTTIRQETPTHGQGLGVATTSLGYSREISNLAKMYTDEDRYSGQPDDSFDYKFGVFTHNCEKAAIPQEARGLAFDTMLTGLAKDYYFKVCRQQPNSKDLGQLCQAIRRRFETSERGRLNLLRWESLTLNEIVTQNEGKSTAQCLDILIKEMTTLQRNLTTVYHSDKLLCDKLINACRSHEACKYACYKAGDTLIGVISDLQASIATHELNRPPTTLIAEPTDEPQSFYIDRRYQGPRRQGSPHPRVRFAQATKPPF